MTWSCLDGGLLSHLLGAFWPFRTDGFWWCMGLPWHYKMANQLFFKQTPLQNHRPGKKGCKKHLYKITNLGGGVQKNQNNTSTKSQTWGGGCANNHFSHIYIFRIPFRVLLGSILSISIFFAYFQINQNDRTRVFKFIPNQPKINQFSLQNQGPLQNDRTRGI